MALQHLSISTLQLFHLPPQPSELALLTLFPPAFLARDPERAVDVLGVFKDAAEFGGGRRWGDGEVLRRGGVGGGEPGAHGVRERGWAVHLGGRGAERGFEECGGVSHVSFVIVSEFFTIVMKTVIAIVIVIVSVTVRVVVRV